MRQNSNEHIVMSIAKTKDGIELQEDMFGTLPELASLLTFYVVHFCRHFAKKEATTDGQKFDPKIILMSIIIAAQHRIDELDLEDLD